MKYTFLSPLFVTLALSATTVNGGPIVHGLCQAGFSAVVVACYSAAGAVFGCVPAAGLAAGSALLACNSAFGTCSATCATVALLAPTP
ncbi:hypothetical protein JCM16303_006949 [Sporobolomyces ruberrimus]